MRLSSEANRQQAGLGVLPIALILLAGASLILLFSQKNFLVDLRITQNGYGSRLAYAAADSGLALVVSQLNDPEHRKSILAETKGNGFYDAITRPTFKEVLGDRIEATVLLKGESLGTSDLRIKIHSTGCVADCARGRAVVSQTMALRGGIHQIPFATVSARGGLDVSGPVTITNLSTGVRGMLMHAGGAIAHDDTVQRQVPSGINPDQAEVPNDARYAKTPGDDFFQQWFGADKAFIQTQATRVACQGECGASVTGIGQRIIWLEGDARLGNGVIGSAAAPVIIIATGNLQIAGGVRITGVVYSMAALTRVQMSNGVLDGALIAENSVVISQGGVLSYNPGVLQRVQSQLGMFIPVPGSWSDGE